MGDSVQRDEDGQSEKSSESKKKIKEIRGKSGRRSFVSRRNQVLFVPSPSNRRENSVVEEICT